MIEEPVILVALTERQADALLGSGDVAPCRLCESSSPAHHCPPQEEAKAELKRQLRSQLIEEKC